MATVNYRDPGSGNFVPIDLGGTPVGAVAAFVGAVAPTGWHLCDGTAHGSAELQAISGSANAPDLRDRFVVGVGTTHAAAATGGAATVTLTGAQSGSPAHTHTSAATGVQSVSHNHTFSLAYTALHAHQGGIQVISIRNTDWSNTAGGDIAIKSSVAAPAKNVAKAHSHAAKASGNANVGHDHVLTIANNAAANAAESHENMPPFYALAFIICTG